MKIRPAPLPGLFLIEPSVLADERGFFMEVFRQDELHAGGIDVTFVQTNHSSSRPNVLRGLHFQYQPPLGKLIRVIHGRAFVVAVDIRKNSSTLGQWFGLELSYDNKIELWAPAGFATGFCALSEGADLEYHYTEIYNHDGEFNIIWHDPAIGIQWPVSDPLVSVRDREAMTLAAWLERPESDTFRLPTIPKNKSLLGELWSFFKARRAWWLTPIILLLLLAGLLIVFGQSSALSPFIYALF